MADDKNKGQAQEQQSMDIGNPDAIEVVMSGPPHPDASAYVLQPVRGIEDMGTIPEDRFMEQVLKGSDEDRGDGVEAHPNENRPASAEDEALGR
jgi:hypothetical protein